MSLTKWTFCQGRTHWRKSNHETRRLAFPDHFLGIYCGIDFLLHKLDLKKEDSLKNRISYLASRISLSYEIRTTRYERRDTKYELCTPSPSSSPACSSSPSPTGCTPNSSSPKSWSLTKPAPRRPTRCATGKITTRPTAGCCSATISRPLPAPGPWSGRYWPRNSDFFPDISGS